MRHAPHRSYYSQEMHSKCQEDSVTMTTASSAGEPGLGPVGLLRRELHSGAFIPTLTSLLSHREVRFNQASVHGGGGGAGVNRGKRLWRSLQGLRIVVKQQETQNT